jgi:hypothetical protein
MTLARRAGNAIAPSLVEAPQPLAPEQAQEQIKAEQQMQKELSQANDAMRAFAAMTALGQRQQAAQQGMSLLQPSVVRGQFRPISMGRGLL